MISRLYRCLFPEELLVLPLVSDVEFEIDIYSGSASVSVAPKEMKELKVRLQELRNRGYFWFSSSPGKTLVCFKKKKEKRNVVHSEYT